MVRLATPLYTAQLPQENTYEVLPEGKYIAVIKKAELKDNKAKTGQVIECQYQIIDGQFKGKSFFDSLNISNPNEVAVSISLARLNTILTIGGLHALEDTDDLVRANIIVLATVNIEEYNGNKKNKVSRLESPNAPQQQLSPQPTMQPITQQSYVAQQPIAQTAPVHQQPQQAQPVQNWQQPQAQQPVAQSQQYAPVAQSQPTMQWQATAPQQPVAPTIQSTKFMLSDEIPFN